MSVKLTRSTTKHLHGRINVLIFALENTKQVNLELLLLILIICFYGSGCFVAESLLMLGRMVSKIYRVFT